MMYVMSRSLLVKGRERKKNKKKKLFLWCRKQEEQSLSLCCWQNVSVTAQNHSFVIIHLWTFLLRCMGAKIILVSNWSVFAFMQSQRNWNQSVLRCWKIKCFLWNSLKASESRLFLYVQIRWQGSFVSTCLNWNCCLTNSVHWNLTSWCQMVTFCICSTVSDILMLHSKESPLQWLPRGLNAGNQGSLMLGLSS